MEIEKLLTSDRISFDLKGGNKEEVIDELIELLCKDGAVTNKKDFKLAVMKREDSFLQVLVMG